MVTADLRESVMKAACSRFRIFSPRCPHGPRPLAGAWPPRPLESRANTELTRVCSKPSGPADPCGKKSLDHGIEPPEARVAAGKNPEGILKCGPRRRAATSSSRSLTTCRHAVEKVRQKLSSAAITAGRAVHLGERELLQLIFLPASRRPPVTTSAAARGYGRGPDKCREDRGKVEIDSAQAKERRSGCAFPDAGHHSRPHRPQRQPELCPAQGALSELVHISSEQAARLSSGSRTCRSTVCAASCFPWSFLTVADARRGA